MLRYYEEQGLIAPLRRGNGYREYDEDLVDRVTKIRGLRESGIPMHIIGDMLSCPDQSTNTAAAPDPELRTTLVRARDRMSECVELLHRHRDALSRYIESMDQTQTVESGREPH
ncbi:MerR family transcriptional regulator [Agreia sp. PsM10]|uniref:MerR family transcriptional regulator n=1 Tax=Agreia sp. PsM10 TaxID=3030533 RepID=UPI003F885AE3